MDIEQQKLQAIVDLGLLTRVACHEINNLVASQQGFLRILQRSSPDDPGRGRWQEQLLAVSNELAILVRGLQSRAHASAPSPGLNPGWQAGSAVRVIADATRAAGAEPGELEIQRMVGLLAELAALNEQTLPTHCQLGALPDLGGAGEPIFGMLADPFEAVAVSLTCMQPDQAVEALRRAADVILPGVAAGETAWRCALLASLLRQASADVVVEHAHEGIVRLHLLLPRRAAHEALPRNTKPPIGT